MFDRVSYVSMFDMFQIDANFYGSGILSYHASIHLEFLGRFVSCTHGVSAANSMLFAVLRSDPHTVPPRTTVIRASPDSDRNDPSPT